jgi:hypothetical protein
VTCGENLKLRRLLEVVKSHMQECPRSPFKRRDDFFVVIWARGVFQRGDLVGEQITVLVAGATTSNYEIFHQAGPEGSGEMLSMTSRPGAAEFFADVHRQIGPTEPDFAALERVPTAHRITVLPPANY